jgi:HlyD family secretion protein
MQKRVVLWITISVAILGGSALLYKKFFKKQTALPYTTQKPELRTIKKIIDATGKLAIANKSKIGSLVTGVLEKLYVEENDKVKKGQLLAIIDTGKDDTDVRESQGNKEKAFAEYQYQQNYYRRQKEIYKAGQLSRDEFEKIEKDYLVKKGEYFSAQAKYERDKMAYDNTMVYAPQDGIIIKVGIAEGERVKTDLDSTVLFEIAQDLTKMEGALEIDESDIGNIKPGQKIKFTVDTFPHKVFKTKIIQVGYSPKKKNSTFFYKAIVLIDNKEKLLRPGLSIEAEIFVAKKKEALTITGQAFMISTKIMRLLAKKLGYSIHPIDNKDLKQKQKTSIHPIETVWVIQKNGLAHTFVEKMITINLTDDIYFEVTSGLNPYDEVIVSVQEENYMDEIMKKYFRNAF